MWSTSRLRGCLTQSIQNVESGTDFSTSAFTLIPSPAPASDPGPLGTNLPPQPAGPIAGLFSQVASRFSPYFSRESMCKNLRDICGICIPSPPFRLPMALCRPSQSFDVGMLIAWPNTERIHPLRRNSSDDDAENDVALTSTAIPAASLVHRPVSSSHIVHNSLLLGRFACLYPPGNRSIC
jgi:hypothetical protein